MSQKPTPRSPGKVSELSDASGTAYILDLVSQNWLTPAEVDRTEWRHTLTAIKPANLAHSTALLFISGGANSAANPPRPSRQLIEIAKATRSVVVELRMVPNQPLTFHGDGKPRTEDDLIAYTWDQFLRTGDERWPARLPMTKAAVRAMDATTAFLASPEGGAAKVDTFVVTGASKRGWTAWTTAAVDRRVVALAPIVIDVLNLEPSMDHHFRAYGFYAPAVGDYVRQRIMDWNGTPELKALYAIEDPFFDRDRLTVPKLLINACGDQFFLPDSSQFYFGALPGEKFLRYIPNTDHSMRNTDAYQTLGALASCDSQPHPAPAILVAHAPPTARSPSPRKPSPPPRSSGRPPIPRPATSASKPSVPSRPPRRSRPTATRSLPRPSRPAAGWTASFIELTFDVGARDPLKLTTDIAVTPDTLPFPAPEIRNPQGLPAKRRQACALIFPIPPARPGPALDAPATPPARSRPARCRTRGDRRPRVLATLGEAGATVGHRSPPRFLRRRLPPRRAPDPGTATKTNVRDFGAVGDGTTDDTKALQAAIDATPAGAVYLPPGRYLVSDYLRITRSGVVLRGAGPEQSTPLRFPAASTRSTPAKAAPAPAHPPAVTLSTALSSPSKGTIAPNPSPRSQPSPKEATAPSRWIAPPASPSARLVLDRAPRGARPQPQDLPLQRRPRRHRPRQAARYPDARARHRRRQRARDLRPPAALRDPRRLAPRGAGLQPHRHRIRHRAPRLRVPRHQIPRPLQRGRPQRHRTPAPSSTAGSGRVIHNGDLGINVVACHNTLDGILLTADTARGTVDAGVPDCTGHHGIQLKNAEDNLITNFEVRAPYVHDLTVEHASGNVFAQGRGIDPDFDHHKDTPYENLFTDIDCGRGTRVWRCGGGASLAARAPAGPRSGISAPPRPLEPAPKNRGPADDEFHRPAHQIPEQARRHRPRFEAIRPRRSSPPNLHAADREALEQVGLASDPKQANARSFRLNPCPTLRFPPVFAPRFLRMVVRPSSTFTRPS